MIYALVVLVRNIRTAVKIKTNSHHNKRQTKVHGLPFVTYYNLMFLNKSPRLVPMLSDLGMTTFSSGSSLTTSSRAFMLRLILPSLMPITFTSVSYTHLDVYKRQAINIYPVPNRDLSCT